MTDTITTYQGRRWRRVEIGGLLPNTRMVRAIFDDANPETRHLRAYPDTASLPPRTYLAGLTIIPGALQCNGSSAR
jgi:hypothetical protein